MNEKGIIDFGDLQVLPYQASPENCINSIEEFFEFDRKIKRGLSYYNLKYFLIKIHDIFLEHKELNQLLPSAAIAGIMSKYVILNSNIASDWHPIYNEEFFYFFSMILSCSLYDPEFERKTQHGDDDFASLILRKIGSQARWNIQQTNMWGRTFYIYDILIKKGCAPDLIRDIVSYKFEEKFGLKLLDFIKLGFLLFCGFQKTGCMSRSYFENVCKQKINIPEDNTIVNCLGLISVSPLAYRKLCNDNSIYLKNGSKIYELNPLFDYPLIRLYQSDVRRDAIYDEFIAPVPQLLAYRFTTGIYHQLFNAFGKDDFSKSFGLLFERYVEDLLQWYHLTGMILSEREIRPIIKPPKKGKEIRIPDWVIFCEEGVILIECKSTKFSQEIYEKGLNAREIAKGCIRQLNKGINQLKSFEQYIPDLIEACDISYDYSQIQKVIVTFEPLLALNNGPLRRWMNIERGANKYDSKIIWVGYLEEIQPYISKGASLWSFLIDFSKLDFNEIINKMQSQTDASYSDSVLCKYEIQFIEGLLK